MKLEELSRILRAADPAVVLIPEPALARVVQAVTGVTWAIWSVPHSHCLSIDRSTLYKHVEPEELYLPADQDLPETVLLLVRPTADQLAASRGDNSALLARYWRLLFHVSVHRELDKRLAGVAPASLRERIENIGTAAFEEARSVLIHDGHLASGADDKAAYIEFAAFFLELKFFAPNLVPVYFPSLPSIAEVSEILAPDFIQVAPTEPTRSADGAEELFRRTRLPNALDPTPKTDDQSDESEDYYRRLTLSAERAANSGDIVASAILHTRAARVAPAQRTGPAQALAKQAIYALVDRLKETLGLTEGSVLEAWREVLPTLLDKADQGARPVEAALLYDLQRACLDVEQKIYTLDVFEWVLSVGHKPIRRELTNLRFVRVPAHLRSAIRRLAAARLTDADRQALGGLLRDALARAEDRLRTRFRPVLTDALKDAGLQPKSLPETAALEKTVEELLDRISSVGYLGFADIRDAIARGQMKLDDLAGPKEYVHDDPLLRLDRRLNTLLDGVYRGGESYTRGLEWLAALGFGTKFGRWVTRNVTLPFGTAVLCAEFVWLLIFERQRTAAVARNEEAPSFLGGWNAAWEFHAIWFALGLFFLAAIRSARVRSVLMTTARTSYRILRTVCWDVPLRVWSNPVIRAAIASVPAQIVINYAAKPLALSGLLWFLFPELWGAGWTPRIITLRLLTFGAAAFLVNSRIGRVGDLLLLEFARGIIRGFRASPAIIRWINDVFRELVDALEWVLARTEDWLRLRGRSGPVAVVVRAVAGVIWMPFAFLIRFYTVVLIEPMINPLKLPLCLLFAKFVYPLLAVMGLFTFDAMGTPSSPLVEPLAPILTEPVAWLFVIGTFWLSPDLVTFLFWEMRENWRLYRANHPDGLKPVAVGPHGEPIRGLLHLSFHSGTVPRLYARLRAAELEAVRTDVWRDARTYRQALRDVEEAVRRFVTRDLVAVVNGSQTWKDHKLNLSVGVVCLGTNRIRVQLILEECTEPAWLEWEDRSGWLVVGCAEAGFLTKLPPGPTQVVENALAYLYKRAGVDLVREQVHAALPKETVHFEFAPGGLLVWYGTRDNNPVLYDPADPVDELPPRSEADRRLIPGQTLDAERTVFDRLNLTWGQWLATWQPHPAGTPEPRFGPTGWELSLLPPRLTPRLDEPPAQLPEQAANLISGSTATADSPIVG